MDMHEANEDTFSLSDLHIYNDPSCYSFQEEQDNGSSFSSISFKLAGSLPAEEIAFLRSLISLPENDSDPYYKPQKSLRMKTFPVQDGDQKVVNLAPVVRPRMRRRSRRGFLMFGLIRSPARMEVYDLRSIQARATPPRIFPVSGGRVEEVTMRRKSGSRLGKLFGACIPTV